MRHVDWLIKVLFEVFIIGTCSSAVAQDPGFHLVGIGSAVVPVSVDKMTNLVFPEAVRLGVKVSRDILAQKVRGVENVIELKAVRRDMVTTNLSVYGKDGHLYSFVLHYTVDTAVLNFRIVPGVGGAGVILSGLPADEMRLREDAVELAASKGFLRCSARAAGLKMRITGVYLRDSLEWLVLEVGNPTQIVFQPRFARYFVEDRKAVKRKAIQEWTMAPVFGGLPAEVGGERRMRFAVGFRPFTVPWDKRLVIEVAGADGRSVQLRVNAKLLLKAKSE